MGAAVSAVAKQAEERSARLSAPTRRKLVHGGFIVAVVSYVSILILGPLIGIAWAGAKAGWSTIVSTVTEPDVLHAYLLSAIITAITVVVTAVFGVIVALVLTRDRFPGKRIMSAVVDLPLAVSPVIVGLMAVILFGRGGWFEPWFTAHGIHIIFAVPSMVIVTIFISLPFVIREVAPVLARTLGASPLQTFFRVTLKNIRWGLLYGVALSTARSIGEIGAVLIVSGQITGKTETATLIVLRFFDQYQDASGYIVALTLALVSILLLTGIEIFKRREERELRR
jgi:sulfate transport system permease protein